MTVPSTTRRAGPFTGNGSTTTFPFTFKSFAASELAVYRTSTTGIETLLTLTTDYSVTLNPDQDASPGGSVSPTVVLAAGERLTIIGATEYTQELDLPTGGQFAPRALEDALDRTIMQIQQLDERADRSLTLPVSATASTVLPVPAAGKVIAWDSSASALINVDATDLASTVAYANWRSDLFSGNGSTTQFTLAADPGNVNNMDVSISGVTQVNGTNFTVSGTTLTFSVAPPAGTNNILVRYGQALPVGTANASQVTFNPAGTTNTRTVQSKLRDVVNVRDFGAVGDGVVDDAAAFTAASTSGGAYTATNGTFKRGGDVQRMAHAAFKTVTSAEANDGKFMEWVEVTNPTDKTGYAIRFAAYVHTGNVNSGRNEISDTLITRSQSIQSGSVWGRWDVLTGPLPLGSGLANAPTVAQSYYMVTSEINPQNRGADPGGWQPENRLWTNTVVGGEQMVAETQDFTGTLGNNRLGYNISFGYAVAKSPFTSNWGGSFEHAKFYNATLVNPNAIALGGFAHFATGFKPYPISVSIANAGSGYTAGDILTFNTGLSQTLNENSQVRVLAVNGSGGVTSAELLVAGSYVTAPSFPQGVTGGTGAGATFNATMATFGSVSPRAFAGISGRWLYGIDFCPNPSQRYASCDNGAMRLPNGATNGIVARNSGDTTDVSLLYLGSNDFPYLGGQVVRSRAAWTPTVTADAGSLTTVTVSNARWSQADGIVHFQLNLQIVNKGTGTGAFRFTLPVNASAHSFVCTGMNVSSGYSLVAFCNSGGSNVVRCTRYDGADPLVSGDFYAVTGFYEAATP